MTRKNISSGGPYEDLVGYSRAVRMGNVVYVAGTTATVNGEVVGIGDFYQQTKVILKIIEAALAAAGASLSDVVTTRIYVTDISKWEAVSKAHSEVFNEIRPAATMVQVAALINSKHLVEIEVQAVIS